MLRLSVSAALAASASGRVSSVDAGASCEARPRTDADESSMLQGRGVETRVSISAGGTAENDDQAHSTTVSDVLSGVHSLVETIQASGADVQNVSQVATEYASILEVDVIPNIESAMKEMKHLLATQRTFVQQCDDRMQEGLKASPALRQSFLEQRSVYNQCVEAEGQIALTFTACHTREEAGEASACSDVEAAYVAKVTECEGLRAPVDAAACTHASHAQAVCLSYSDCRANSMAVYEQAAKSADRRADNHRTQLLEAKQAQCMARGLAASGGDSQRITQMLEECNDLLPSTEDESLLDEDTGVMPPMLVCQDVAARPCLDGRVGLDIGDPSKWNAPCQACPALSTITPAPEVPKAWSVNMASWLSTAATRLEEAADPRRRSASTLNLLGLSSKHLNAAGSESSGELMALVLAVPLAAMLVALCVAVAFIPASRQDSESLLKEPVSRSGSASTGRSSSKGMPSTASTGPAPVQTRAPGSRPSLASMNRPSFGGGTAQSTSPSLANLSSQQLSPIPHALQSPQFRSRQEPTGLCPELTVPEGSECILGIPSIAEEDSGEVSLKNITDKFGQPLLFVGLTSAPAGGEFILLTKKDQQELAFCELTTGDADGWRGKIFRWDGELFARVREETASERGRDSITSAASSMYDPAGPSFVVCSATGSPWELRVTGNIHDRRMTIENEAQEVVAMVSPGEELAFQGPQGPRTRVDGEFYKLRLAPHGDTCTIIVAFLAIERMLNER